jgi:predicted RNA-binding Zn ribbon-like protein
MKTIAASETSRAGSLPLIGKELALDFANTASGRGSPTHQDHLRRAEDVVAWAQHARVLTAADVDRVSRVLSYNRKLAGKLVARALKLRDLVYSIGATVAAGRKPEDRSIQQLVQLHGECIAHSHLRSIGETFAWTWDATVAPVQAILGPIALSALTLLTQADLSRIKQCEGQFCGWLFFDVTKNKRRRWCEMEVCGNRAKQRRFHARQHEGTRD